jgi:tetratricopeptide (TPR) repeat protein
MVLPAPPAHDELPPGEAGWVEQLKLSIRLARTRGILILVDHAVPERLGDLVRGLVGEFPDLDVHAELAAVEDAPEGAVMVLIPRPEHAEALNMGRPIFARRKLKVVLWCDPETTVALKEQAPDFFSWVSEYHECPPGPVAHAVAGLRAAYEAGAPGIVWRGSGDQEDKARLLTAFSAAFPGETLTWIDPKRDYEELLGAIKEAKSAWIACRAQAASHVRRLRWAMAEGGKSGRAIVMTDKYPCPGWWPVHDRLMPFAEARHALEVAGSRSPGALAALAGLEPEAVELLRALLEQGVICRDLREQLRKADDPGVALGSFAKKHELVCLGDVSRGEAVPPILRTFARDSEMKKSRASAIDGFRDALATGQRVSEHHIGLWASSGNVEGVVPATVELLAPDHAVEAYLRRVRDDKGWWLGLAQRALLAGEIDVAGVWSQRAAAWFSDRNVDAMASRLAALGDRRAMSIRASLRRDRSLWRSAPVLALLVSIGIALLSSFRGLRQIVFGLVLLPMFWIGATIALVVLWQSYRLYAYIRRWATEQASAARFGPRSDASFEHLRRGEYIDAAQSLKELIATEEGKLTEEHPSIRRALELLARALVEQDEDERALPALQHSIALEGRVIGVETPLFTALLLSLTTLLLRTGRARDAEELLRKLLGSDAPAPLSSEERPEPPVRTLASIGNQETDEYLQLFLALPKPPPLSDEHRAEALRLLAEACVTQGRYDEAEGLLERALGQADAALPPDHPERWRTLTTYGRVLLFQRRPAEAEPVLRRALDLAEKHADERHPDTARILAALARVEHALVRAEAPATARRALEIYEGAQLADAEKTLARADLTPIADAPSTLA